MVNVNAYLVVLFTPSEIDTSSYQLLGESFLDASIGFIMNKNTKWLP